MRKFINNHFNQSRIFKHARFVVAADGGDSGEGLDTGAASSGGSSDSDGSSDDLTGELESLRSELAKAKADALRYKNTNDKLLKEKGELTKKNREMMSADQLEKEAKEERDRQFEEMAKELRANRYSKRLVGLGMTEKDADAFAASIPELEDIDAFFNTLGSFIKSYEKTASEKAIQDLLKNRPEINAGNGDADKDDPAMALAKRSVEQRKAVIGTASNDIIKMYTL